MNYNLKYLYRAIYKDGKHYDQNAKDISIADPNKSCYYDLKVDQIRYFVLSDGVISYSLDLNDGGVSVNGMGKFFLTADPLTKFRLIYFRRVVINLQDSTLNVKYHLGYEAEDVAGNQVTHTIVIL